MSKERIPHVRLALACTEPRRGQNQLASINADRAVLIAQDLAASAIWEAVYGEKGTQTVTIQVTRRAKKPFKILHRN